MKKNPVYIIILTFWCSVMLSACVTTHVERPYQERRDSFMHAVERAQLVVEAINTNQPQQLYLLLQQEYRDAVSEEEFIRRYVDERSYPYLTPLYLYLDGVDLNDDGSASIICTVASRLPGEKYHFALVYENGLYFASIFEELVDGSYRDKFSNMVKW